MKSIFILRLHTKEVDEKFLVFENSYPVGLYTDRIKLENDYNSSWNLSVKTTPQELKSKILNLPYSVQSALNTKLI